MRLLFLVTLMVSRGLVFSEVHRSGRHVFSHQGPPPPSPLAVSVSHAVPSVRRNSRGPEVDADADAVLGFLDDYRPATSSSSAGTDQMCRLGSAGFPVGRRFQLLPTVECVCRRPPSLECSRTDCPSPEVAVVGGDGSGGGVRSLTEEQRRGLDCRLVSEPWECPRYECRHGPGSAAPTTSVRTCGKSPCPSGFCAEIGGEHHCVPNSCPMPVCSANCEVGLVPDRQCPTCLCNFGAPAPEGTDHEAPSVPPAAVPSLLYATEEDLLSSNDLFELYGLVDGSENADETCRRTKCPEPRKCVRTPRKPQRGQGASAASPTGGLYSADWEETCVCPSLTAAAAACPSPRPGQEVCGTDGVTYPSSCRLRLAACLEPSSYSLEIAYEGTCQSAGRGPTTPGGVANTYFPPDVSAGYSPTTETPPNPGTSGYGNYNSYSTIGRPTENPGAFPGLTGSSSSRDPCRGVVCLGSRQCFPDAKGRPTCKCDPGCPSSQHDHRGGRAGSRNYDRDPFAAPFASGQYAGHGGGDGGVVCGSDDRTHVDVCALRFRACRVSQDIRVVGRGPCRPRPDENDVCQKISCLDSGGVCKVANPADGPRCTCDFDCAPPDNPLRPVCGSDGKTYKNACDLRLFACESHVKLRVDHEGPCEADDPCWNVKCIPPRICKVSRTGPKCVCDIKCPLAISGSDAVCGTDKKTYGSVCFLQQRSCQTGRDIRVLRRGPCPTEEEEKCSKVACIPPRKCRLAANGVGRDVECVCPTVERCLVEPGDVVAGALVLGGPSSAASSVLRPVCGSDRVLYPTVCHMVAEACARNVMVEVLQHDFCPYEDPCKTVKCLGNSVCQAVLTKERKDRADCVCLDDCPSRPPPEDAVCGSDGRSYPSACSLGVAACRSGRNLTVVSRGPCSAGQYGDGSADLDPCQSVKCQPPTVCQRRPSSGGRPPSGADAGFSSDESTAAVCGCPPISACQGRWEPVCADDGRTYRSRCHLLALACRLRRVIAVVHAGDCVKKSPCESVQCVEGRKCVVARSGEAACVCDYACSDDYGSSSLVSNNGSDSYRHPLHHHHHGGGGQLLSNQQAGSSVGALMVCASDGKSYPSECHVRRRACETGLDLAVTSYGPCHIAADPCSRVDCLAPKKCRVISGVAACVCQNTCGDGGGGDDVDGVVYPSACRMKLAACQKDMVLTEADPRLFCKSSSVSAGGAHQGSHRPQNGYGSSNANPAAGQADYSTFPVAVVPYDWYKNKEETPASVTPSVVQSTGGGGGNDWRDSTSTSSHAIRDQQSRFPSVDYERPGAGDDLDDAGVNRHLNTRNPLETTTTAMMTTAMDLLVRRYCKPGTCAADEVCLVHRLTCKTRQDYVHHYAWLLKRRSGAGTVTADERTGRTASEDDFSPSCGTYVICRKFHQLCRWAKCSADEVCRVSDSARGGGCWGPSCPMVPVRCVKRNRG